MRFFKITLVFLVVLGLLPMTGCGGSDNGSANVDDPLAPGRTALPRSYRRGHRGEYTLTLSTTGGFQDEHGRIQRYRDC